MKTPGQVIRAAEAALPEETRRALAEELAAKRDEAFRDARRRGVAVRVTAHPPRPLGSPFASLVLP